MIICAIEVAVFQIDICMLSFIVCNSFISMRGVSHLLYLITCRFNFRAVATILRHLLLVVYFSKSEYLFIVLIEDYFEHIVK